MPFTPVTAGSEFRPTTTAGLENGCSIGLSGTAERIVVGQPLYDAGNPYGRLYTYSWNGSSYSLFGSALTVAGSTNRLLFSGLALSNDGDLMIVGAPGLPGAAGNTYTYVMSGSTWTLGASSNTTRSSANDKHGAAVAVNGDGTIQVAGAPGGNVVNVYRGRTGYAWNTPIEISAPASVTEFGRAVGITADGNVLYVSGIDGSSVGKVYVYDWNSGGSSWDIRAGTIGAGAFAQAGDNFGSHLSISADGKVLTVGANAYDDANTDEGAVYIFDISGGTATLRNQLLPSSPENTLNAGPCALSGNGSVMLAGLPGRTSTNARAGGLQRWATESGATPGTGANYPVPVSGTGDIYTPLAAFPTSGFGYTGIATEGSGAITSSVFVATAGVLLITAQATGSLVTPKVQASGAGGCQTSEIVAPAISVAGEGVITILATGGVNAPRPLCEGTLIVPTLLQGAIRTPRARVSGEAILTTTGSGAVSTPRLRTSGSLVPNAYGQGAVTTPAIDCVGLLVAGVLAQGGVRTPKIIATGKTL